jgi:hypothetical protein
MKIARDGYATFLRLTDNSKMSSPAYEDCGRVYDIIEGENGKFISNYTEDGYGDYGSFGIFCPDIGLIVLNSFNINNTFADGTALYNRRTPASRMTASLSSYATSYYSPAYSNYWPINPNGIFANQPTFQLLSEETISSTIIFCRIKNQDYNYSSNPSYLSGSGNLLHNSMIDNSRTYITTVGLYNDQQDLLAVAKLSKPLLKDFTKEALIKVKLDW